MAKRQTQIKGTTTANAHSLARSLPLCLCAFQQQWANGNIICNELTKKEDRKKSQWWGDHFLAPLRDMLGEACREREMPDCEFFLNKRDYPQLKVNVPRGVPGKFPRIISFGGSFDILRPTLGELTDTSASRKQWNRMASSLTRMIEIPSKM